MAERRVQFPNSPAFDPSIKPSPPLVSILKKRGKTTLSIPSFPLSSLLISPPSPPFFRILQGGVFSAAAMANSASGIAVDDDCKLKFLELKAKRNFRFIVFKLDEKALQITVDRLGNPEESYDDFTACLPPNECRYAVYDFDFITDENCQKSKIFFIAWSPDTSRVRSKMLYASSKDRFKRELDGIQLELQATDPSEMSLDIVKGRAL
ncbi:hypothetical protein HPP92_004702 [Vanilla planifolia]|uniref:ADF-H domain-containing protein n=1 Tax=Vanilla planifolia TaxID=51239 RepID=A0A835V8Q0_VANPL|nr:hypothetical protein HPP92_005047 [Vanilla planifolia]KAG0493708.1 hypothetical protein HPP92_004702 [Vanilla planifolia]